MKSVQQYLLFFCLLLSLGVHILLGLGIFMLPQPYLPQTPRQLTVMEIIESSAEEQLNQQIVQQNPDLSYRTLKPPKNAKFLSQYHQNVGKQTASKKTYSHLKQKDRSIASIKPSLKTSKPLHLSLSDLTPQMNWDKYILKMNSSHFSQKEKTQSQFKSVKDEITFSNEALFQPNDYIEDVPEGQQTLLNTKAFQFYTYYTRMKEQVQASWEPMIKAKIRDMLISGKSMMFLQQKTRLLVTLNHAGALIDVKVLKKSQFADLDRIAIQSFHKTAPFPHPPKKLIGDDGTIKIKWDFILFHSS